MIGQMMVAPIDSTIEGDKMSQAKDIVLIVGGGGREHAVIKALAQSNEIAELHAAPGNGGISELAVCHPISATDIAAQVDLAQSLGCDFVVVTPDDPLALGLVDSLAEKGIKSFGPSAAAARLESSKVFAKELMNKLSIPTAAAAIFQDAETALAGLEQCTFPLVIKAEGLAQGKGVIICQNKESASRAINDIMRVRKFGDAGDRILIEEFLTGPEVTAMCFCDGKHLLALPSSRDHKRIGEGDTGENTGGMGVIAPVPEMSEALQQQIMETIFEPVIQEMAANGTPFRGILYAGLMLTEDGPYVIEFNARFGDPETQAVLPLVKNDLYTLLKACVDGDLHKHRLEVSDKASCVVIMASGGYPGKYKTGCEITGLDLAEDVFIYHAGTVKKDNTFFTAGGRVLAVSAQAKTLSEAIDKAYMEVDKISFENCVFRRDIGKDCGAIL